MKGSKVLLTFLALGLLVFVVTQANAQCAMCSATVETSNANGGGATSGLNNGIMYLLAAPYLAVAVVGYIWYKKYRKKDIPMEMRNEKLHLN
ncbi:hypothetical protein ACFQZS_13465 [Mucilaginibacter calamicampi]|uniref:Uncharacterized protein n=1 Tax=Mucilaginibacter calamicampi TaxID=1302352 RepID=A0ABW2YZ82_9SPHI